MIINDFIIGIIVMLGLISPKQLKRLSISFNQYNLTIDETRLMSGGIEAV
jgi:hypothetical protein